jgi:hypothetical protein
MSDYLGYYDKLLNAVEFNNPLWMRKEVTTLLFTEYDNIFRPVMQDIFPRTTAPVGEDGEVPSIDTTFSLPHITDPQYMSRFYDYLEMPDPRAVGFDKEECQARMTKEWGPQTNPLLYKNEWKAGFLEKKNQMLVANKIRAIERFIEYNLVNYTFGTASVMDNFGNQRTKQSNFMKSWDAKETVSTESDYLGGKSWDDTSADVLNDIDTLNLWMNEVADEEINVAYLGANTLNGMQHNQAIKELLKYHYDLTGRMIGGTLRGVNLKKVIGQTYKDDSTSSTRIGYPGQGSVKPDGYTTRYKYKMMTHVDSGSTYEWGLFVPGPIGNTFTAKCHPEHANPNSPYPNEWEDPRTKAIFSEIQMGFAPHVINFKNVFVVKRLAESKV